MTTHLPQLEQHVTEAAVRRAGVSRVRVRLIGRPAALAIAGVLVLGGAAGAVVLGDGSVDPAISANLAVLRGARTPADDIGAVGRRLQVQEQRVASDTATDPEVARQTHRDGQMPPVTNFAASRRIRSNVPKLTLWLVPRSDNNRACLIVQDYDANLAQAGGPCLTRDQVNVGSAPQTFAFQGRIDLLGIVPDGVARVQVRMTDGAEHTVIVIDNVYAARFTNSTASVSYKSPSGHVTLPAPAG